MVINNETVHLSLYDSFEIYPLKIYGSGSYEKLTEIRGNSLLSTLFIKSISAGSSLEVKYFDFTTGRLFGEKYYLETHGIISSSITTPISYKLIVPRIHNKVVCEAIVNGNVEFSVYVTCVSDFPQAPKIGENQIVDISGDRGTPVVLFDEDDNRWHFARGNNGIQEVSFERLKTPTITNLVLSQANTIYSYNFPDDTKKFYIRNTGNSLIRFSFSPTMDTYLSLFPSESFSEDDILLKNFSIYFQSFSSDQKVEILSWI